ncbi:hypothetical protein [Xanthobacter sp. 91]|uniref:VirB4 family type IV secretion/conjugal transfer ATPase n=1 Tax=Xanthobacter sp. 91 TaxID=1117244 RepID=UPI000A8613C5|nr:hypothetical protein [Xanthobacter sp. 91]
MMNLAEYRRQGRRLADYLPWAALVGPGIVLNKDGSFQRTARFRGPDLKSSVPSELVAVAGRLNSAFRRLGSGWALFVEAQRHEAGAYPESYFPDPASALVDAERKAGFAEAGSHFESSYFLTFCWLPPAEDAARAESWLYEGRGREGVDPREALDGFADRTDRVLRLVEALMPECRWLDDAETLTYLHGCVSTRRQRVSVPETPMYLDALLADQPLTGGLEPMLGDQHIRVLTIVGFPTATTPGILDDLNRLAFPYRWSTRAILLDKTDATRLLTKIRRQWFAKRKSIAAILKEVMTNEASVLVDSDAANKAEDADLALQELGADHAGIAYVTATVTVWDADPRIADEKLRLVEKVIQGRDFTAMVETINAVDAWLGSLPGHVYANVRQPPVSTLNLAHMIPLSAVWAGDEQDAHFAAPPLFYGKTEGSTPFRFSLHVGDVGHTLVVGPTGAVRNAGLRRVDELMRDAMLDPAIAKALLAKVPAGRESAAGRAFADTLARLSLVPPIVSYSRAGADHDATDLRDDPRHGDRPVGGGAPDFRRRGGGADARGRNQGAATEVASPGMRNGLAPAPDARERRPALSDTAAHEAATSPTNDRPEPTQAQKEAGNYKLGHLRLGGLDISVENPQGSERKGVDPNGKAWSVQMKHHYGYIKGTVGRDKDHVDVFVRPGTETLADDAPVFIVNQKDPRTGRFDEHKVMLGYQSIGQAERAYLSNYAKGWDGLGGITRMTLPAFREWVRDPTSTKNQA